MLTRSQCWVDRRKRLYCQNRASGAVEDMVFIRATHNPCGNVSCGGKRTAPAARSKAQHNLLKIRWGWRQADCQSAAGWQPAPQYFGGLSSHLVGRRPNRTARIGRPTTRRDWATKHRHDAFTRV